MKKATEIFGNESKLTVIEVNFYAGSYQFRNPLVYKIGTIEEFERLKSDITDTLRVSKLNSTSLGQKETFWATFTPEGEDFDLFDERVRI